VFGRYSIIDCLFRLTKKIDGWRDRDTVASVGLYRPFARSPSIIRHFRQALSLDERRVKFMPNPWHKATSSWEGAVNDPNNGSAIPKHILGPILQYVAAQMGRPPPKRNIEQDDDTGEDIYFGGKLTCVKEVWFPGSHSGAAQQCIGLTEGH
jgi:hypothetical protein